MKDSSTCPVCGTPLPCDGGLCPACLLHAAMGDGLPDQAASPEAAVAADHKFPSIAERLGARIGRYKLLEQIGEGGFGVVWMAEQEEPVRRRVALKIIKPGMDTREVIARFEAERQALAMMEHPNIASVFDGGVTETGLPYFVMELVKGVPITTYCDANRLTTRERLELFIEVCHAVQHAHQKGVIHRDLKPSNILVTVKDDHAVPKVIDFGIAKATQATLTDQTLFTRLNQWLGTPEYMSPEQAGLGSLDVDTRSDIYSLGVLLYELFTGRPPFDTEKLLASGYDAVMRTIREEEPPKPSTRLGTLTEEELTAVAAKRGAEPAKLNHLLRGDLDWIVMKALEKDRRRRYETANALARDLELHLNHEPVSAAAPTLGYRLRKLVRRHRKAAAWTLSFALLLVLTAIVGTTLAIYAQRQKVRAVIAEHTALDNLYAADMGLAQRALETRQLAHARELLRSYIPKSGEVDRRGIEWGKLWAEARGGQVAIISTPIKGKIGGLAFTPDDEFIVATGAGGRLCVIQAEDFKLVFSTNADTSGSSSGVAISADGKLVATCSDGSDGSASIWKMNANGTLELAWQIAERDCWSVAFSPDGRTLAVGMQGSMWGHTHDGGITRLFDVATGRQLTELPESGGRAVAFSSDGRWLATGSWNGAMVNLWDARKLSLVTRIPFEEAVSLAFSPDNQLLLAGFINGKMNFYRVPGLEKAVATSPLYGGRAIISLSARHQLVARCHGPVITIQDLSGNELKELFGHETEPCSAAFDHRGDWLVSGASDGKILVWNVPGRRLTAPASPPIVRYFRSLPLPPSSPSGSKIAVLASDGVRVLDAAQWRTSAPLCPAAYPLTFMSEDSLLVFRGLTFLEDGNLGRPHTNDPAPRLEWWDLRAMTHTGVEISRLKDKQVTAVAVSPDKAALVLAWRVSETTNGLEFVDAHSGELRGSIAGLTHRITGLAFAPNGRSLAVAVNDRVELIAFPSGEKLKTLVGGVNGCAERPAFSPDGKLLAVGFRDGIRLWTLPDGHQIRFLGGYSALVASLQFSADNKTLVAWGGCDTKFWHVATWREILQLERQGPVSKPWITLTGEKYVCFSNRSANWEVAALAPRDHAEEWLRAQPANLTEARQLLYGIPPSVPKPHHSSADPG